MRNKSRIMKTCDTISVKQFVQTFQTIDVSQILKDFLFLSGRTEYEEQNTAEYEEQRIT